MQADAKVGRNRLGAVTRQDAPANLLLPRGQYQETLAGLEQPLELLAPVGAFLLLAVSRHNRRQRRRELRETNGLGARKSSLIGGPVKVHIEAGIIYPDRGSALIDDLSVFEEHLPIGVAVHARRKARQQDRPPQGSPEQKRFVVRVRHIEMPGI